MHIPGKKGTLSKSRSNRKMHNEVSKVCLLLSLGAEHDISRYLPPWDGFLFSTASGFRNYLPLENVVNGILFSLSGLSKMTTNGIVTKWNQYIYTGSSCRLWFVICQSAFPSTCLQDPFMPHMLQLPLLEASQLSNFQILPGLYNLNAKRFVKSSKTFDETFTVGW